MYYSINQLLGTRVFVYRNLHKKCFSVKSLNTGRVICHVDSITLVNVKFRVGKAGRERVLRERKKNVHAGVVGYIAEATMLGSPFYVGYNPYKYSSFVKLSDENKIETAKIALIDNKGILVLE
jgi:hypothetical protein